MNLKEQYKSVLAEIENPKIAKSLERVFGEYRREVSSVKAQLTHEDNLRKAYRGMLVEKDKLINQKEEEVLAAKKETQEVKQQVRKCQKEIDEAKNMPACQRIHELLNNTTLKEYVSITEQYREYDDIHEMCVFVVANYLALMTSSQHGYDEEEWNMGVELLNHVFKMTQQHFENKEKLSEIVLDVE